jgi:hypothetical protein
MLPRVFPANCCRIYNSTTIKLEGCVFGGVELLNKQTSTTEYRKASKVNKKEEDIPSGTASLMLL